MTPAEGNGILLLRLCLWLLGPFLAQPANCPASPALRSRPGAGVQPSAVSPQTAGGSLGGTKAVRDSAGAGRPPRTEHAHALSVG